MLDAPLFILTAWQCLAQVARIETEKLLLQLLETELGRRTKEGTFSGKFAGLAHYFGYEGRCSMPTNFDATCALSWPLCALDAVPSPAASF